MRTVLLAMLSAVASVAGCDSGSVDPRQFDSAPARRLIGVWTLELIREPVRFTAARARADTIRGTVALIGGRSGPAVSWNAHTMPEVGAFDLALDRWGYAPGSHQLVARTYGDSVELVVDPGAGAAATRLAGTWHGDRVTGAWTSDRGRGAADAGWFSLVRQR